MRNFFIILVSAIILAACASARIPQSSVPIGGKAATSNGGFFLYGTLTEPGTVEFRLAPLYTRNAVLRQTAARRLDSARLDVDTAKLIQAKADAARSRIDEAKIFQARPEVMQARIDQAKAIQDEIEQLLREKTK